MIRIRRPLEIGHVASDAVRARQVVIVVHMALSTLQSGMRAGQWKARVVVVERSVGPLCHLDSNVASDAAGP